MTKPLKVALLPHLDANLHEVQKHLTCTNHILEVAALDGVRALYDEIDKKQISGLGAVLKDALEDAK